MTAKEWYEIELAKMREFVEHAMQSPEYPEHADIGDWQEWYDVSES